MSKSVSEPQKVFPIELTKKELDCLEKYHPLHFRVVKECLVTGECILVEKLSAGRV